MAKQTEDTERETTLDLPPGEIDAWLTAGGCNKPDPGFVTREQLQTLWGTTTSPAKRRLKKLREAGLVEVQSFLGKPHYRLKTKKPR